MLNRQLKDLLPRIIKLLMILLSHHRSRSAAHCPPSAITFANTDIPFVSLHRVGSSWTFASRLRQESIR